MLPAEAALVTRRRPHQQAQPSRPRQRQLLADWLSDPCRDRRGLERLVRYCARPPMRLIAFIMEPPMVEKILSHIGEPTEPPVVLPARAPPQVEIGYRRRRDCVAIQFDQVAQANEWLDINQTAETTDETWN